MKYFSLDSVVSAYDQISDTTKDKFWGILGVLYSIEREVEPNKIYKVDTVKLATFLETTFRLYDKKDYDNSAVYSVAFADNWSRKVSSSFLVGRPSILPIIIWAYRRQAFEETTSIQSIFAKFLNDFHLSKDVVEEMFSIHLDDASVRFSEGIYKDRELLIKLDGKSSDGTPTIKMNKSFVVANAGDLTRGPFFQPLYASLNTLECLIIFPFNAGDYYRIFTAEETKQTQVEIEKLSKQIIFYGAPGTGKSHTINKMCSKYESFRTTFHPDTDYASFVGAYKPITIKVPVYGPQGQPIKDAEGKVVLEDRIVYRYVFQAFLKAYVAAWKEQQNEKPAPVFLIVEELNRGNCSQIFGDIFQLLDRQVSGFSNYPICSDDDLAQELRTVLSDLNILNADKINAYYKGGRDVVAQVKSGTYLLLPNNLYIWATMNTSDQSLFPIDSAFKRRWDWRYIKIKNSSKNYRIVFSNGKTYNWWDLLSAINAKIEGGDIQQEDKKLGYFFVKADKDGIISAENFLSKVIFYLYNDVFKDFGFDAEFFKDEEGKIMTFASYFNHDGKVDESRVERFIINLGYRDYDSDGLQIVEEENAYDEMDDSDDEDAKTKDYTRYSINGEGAYNKKNVACELVKLFIEKHPEMSASEVVAKWRELGNLVSHFIETKEEYDARTDKKDRMAEIDCNGEWIYVSTNGWGGKEKMNQLKKALEGKDWGLRISEV